MEKKPLSFNIFKEGGKLIVKGRQGDKGDTPTKEELLNLIEPLIPEPIKGEPGEDGKDYTLTEKDKKEIAKTIKVPVVEKIIERTETIIEQPIVTNEIKEVAKYEEADDLKEKLESLKGDKRLDASAIKNLPEAKYYGGGGSHIKDIIGGTDIEVDNTNYGYPVINYIGSASMKTWTDYATRWTSAPTTYDTQATYTVYEYTYGTTKYYRKVLNTYDPTEDNFYSDDTLSTLISSRALTI